MSSATSIDQQGLRPWQFFLLAGMLSATAVVIVATGQSPASIIMLSVTVIAASLVALATYRALAPLVLPEGVQTFDTIAGRTRAALEREKTLVLRSIKELEFDYAMGKMTKTDFDDMSGRLRARAIGLMRQLDASGGYRELIERELAKRSKLPAPSVSAPSSASASSASALSATSATSAPSALSAASAVCPSCEGVNDADARFCKHCGNKLTV